MSRSSISARPAPPNGHRTTAPERIWSAHISVLAANPAGRRNVHSAPDSSIARSTRAQNESGWSAAGCADRYTIRLTCRAAISATFGASPAVTSGEVNGHSRNSDCASCRCGSSDAGSARSACTASACGGRPPGPRLTERTGRPLSVSCVTTWRPTLPVPPTTTIIMTPPCPGSRPGQLAGSDARTSTNVEVKGEIRRPVACMTPADWSAMDSYDWHEAGLTVGQVAERSGARPSALRFYERQGLISTDRTAGNQRRYRGDVLCRVAMIRVCQQAGLSLANQGRPGRGGTRRPDPRPAELGA